MKHAISPLVALVALVAATLCACQGPVTIVAPGQRQAAITHGVPYNGHPAVGLLEVQNLGGCTATLVGKRTVLTAAHCIEPGAVHTFHAGGQAYKATVTLRHPQYNRQFLFNDIGLVFLASAPPIAAATITSTPPTVGLGVTLIGYGQTGETNYDDGIKRIATNTIARVDATTIAFLGSGGGIGNTCYGDSGGPAYSMVNGQEVIVGVTSSGTKPCGVDGTDTRVDTYKSWLTATAAGDIQFAGGTTPPPPPPPPTDPYPPQVRIASPADGATLHGSSFTITADARDNVGVTKIELRANGALVGTGSNVPHDFAVTLPVGEVVLQATAYDAAGNKVSASITVTVEPAAPEPTPQPSQGTKGFGEDCSGPSDCISGICANSGAGTNYCSNSCNASMNNCPQLAECLPSSMNSHVCGPPQPSVGGGPDASGENKLTDTTLRGSCSATGEAPPLSLVALLCLALVLVSRRRAS